MVSVQKLPELTPYVKKVVNETVNEAHFDSSDEEYELDK
jgi:hypothetical protein